METKLKKYGQMLLGVAILGTAVLTQSFTEKASNGKKLAGIHRYYNTTGSPSTNPNDFVYQGDDVELCNSDNSKECSREWDLGTANPTIGQAPPMGASIVPNSAVAGEYQAPSN
ncbi:hypothetical protein [Sphingobacterium thalpophilum]|uniref:hypothetical protein n=1 Tax=Sphingobacterium thalpophilum TaxID=259 RepID=UPI003D964B79